MITAVIDQGNTRLKLALFKDEQLQTVLRFDLNQEEEIHSALTSNKVELALYAASGEWNQNLLNNVKKSTTTLAFDQTLNVPFEVVYDSRETVGTDRLANAAMSRMTNENQSSLVVDLGTCITYDILHEDQFLGGAISPGLLMRSRAMNAFTARLPEVALDTNVPLTGNSTFAALQSGAYHGWRAEIQQMVSNYTEQYPGIKVIFTGGDLSHFEAGLKSRIFADPYWTLKGFNQILLFNAQ
ncbi:MAG: type III pantothenate kinase [Flavobacteriales bacterium]|jgi:type III pantothenate kinase